MSYSIFPKLAFIALILFLIFVASPLSAHPEDARSWQLDLQFEVGDSTLRDIDRTNLTLTRGRVGVLFFSRRA